jgi:hypothetical protein
MADFARDFSVPYEPTRFAVRAGLTQAWFGITPAHVSAGMVGVSLRDPNSVFMGTHVGQ